MDTELYLVARLLFPIINREMEWQPIYQIDIINHPIPCGLYRLFPLEFVIIYNVTATITSDPCGLGNDAIDQRNATEIKEASYSI